MKVIPNTILLITVLLSLISCSNANKQEVAEWPEISHATKPWTRWWWHGSAVTKQGITAELEALYSKGFGGVEITPIFGVVGEDSSFIDYLSDEWVGMLLHTLSEAKRLNLGVDMATGTGWPFGGPWVLANDACKNLIKKEYQVEGGQTLKKTIACVQESMFRKIGIRGQHNQQIKPNDATLTLDQLKEPLYLNDNLQALALEQIRFKKSLPLVSIMAYAAGGEVIDLMPYVNDGELAWNAPIGDWQIYELYQGWHGKMVERAAPGGEGNVIDHFSKTALNTYLLKFDSAFADEDISGLRSFFNDSYEVDDAKGAADWTPDFLNKFKEFNGYDLQNHWPALFGQDQSAINERILCDYRTTVAKLLLKNFTLEWKKWAHGKGALVRNQAHGSPANILDLYAEVDIPEMEGSEPLRIKMASSAANVTGKKLVSSESATWLNEHFKSTLADLKQNMDNYFLNGINHVFYHGTTYSPKEDEWPGRLFYAAVHVNDRNPMWEHIQALNKYIARCQSILQAGVTDNDVLLYFPIYDRYSTPGKELLEHIDKIDDRYNGTVFKQAAEEMFQKGVAFDYISDKQISTLTNQVDKLKSAGDSYKTLIIPACKYIPLKTFKQVVNLARQGAQVIFLGGLPQYIAGYANYELQEQEYKQLIESINWQQMSGYQLAQCGIGQLYSSANLFDILKQINVYAEPMNALGLRCIRKQQNGKYVYFISNPDKEPVASFVKLNSTFKDAVIYNPMNAKYGKAKVNDDQSIYLEVQPKQSLIVELHKDVIEATEYLFFNETSSIELAGEWHLSFNSIDGAKLEDIELDSLCWLNELPEPYATFSGTVNYLLTFNKPVELSKYVKLHLGNVASAASVIINGKEIRTLIGPNYEIIFDGSILKSENNTLQIVVSTTMQNKIIELEKQGKHWKKFYNVNFPPSLRENQGSDRLFTPTNWSIHPEGLKGPVSLIELKAKC